MTAQRASLLILAIIAATIYVLRLDDVAGLTVDDAWYILLAKAVANGDGYRLVSSATTPFVPTVPPGFPIALAPVFLVSPSYPGNLLLLKLVSVLAMFGVGAACWFDFTRHRELKADQAAWLSFLVVVAPPFVFLATSTVMAECLFTLVQLLAILAIERASRDRQATPMLVVAAVLAAMAMLIRTAGLALVVAVLAYLVIKRQWRRALITTATVTVCLLPWQIYSSLAQSPFEERAVHSSTITYSYSELIAMARPGSVNAAFSPTDWLARAADNVAGIVTRDVGAAILPEIFRGSSESGEEVVSVGPPGRGSMGSATGTKLASALFALVMLLGVIRARAWLELPFLLIAASIGMIAAVGAETYRYVLPLMPFLLVYFLRGLAHPSAVRIAVLCLVGLHGMDHALYLRDRAAGASTWIADAREIDEVVSWMHDNIHGAAAVASTNPGLIYLRTGRKGLGSGEPLQNWGKWKSAGVRYVVALRDVELPPPGLNGRVVFRSSRRRLWIVEM